MRESSQQRGVWRRAARNYGGLGVVLAIYFWLAFSSAIIVWTASLLPALADRRNPRRAAPIADSSTQGTIRPQPRRSK
jgi:uncharacterized BrkB/YihY/UPF0761 family membrane protein